MTLPEWYRVGPLDAVVTGGQTRRARPGWARRTLIGLGEVLARELATPAAAGSWLARVEPRAKTLGLLLLTVGATLLHSLGALVVLLGVAVALALSNGLRPRHLMRVWLGVPLFSLAIVLPATLNVVTPGTPVLDLWHLGPGVRVGPWPLPETLSVTRSGLVVAGRFLLRSTDCVTLMYLLVATTGPAELISTLRRLGMPRAFGMVLAMAHRYLIVLLRAAEEIHLAKISRTLESGTVSREQRWVAAGAGVLFRRTYQLAQDIHAAMISRGYDGDLQVPPTAPWHLRDTGMLVASAALFAALRMIDPLL